MKRARPGSIDCGASNADALASQNALLGINSLEHRRVLEDIGNDNKSNEPTADEYLLQCCYGAVAPRHRHIRHAAIHVVFCLLQSAPIKLPQPNPWIYLPGRQDTLLRIDYTALICLIDRVPSM